MKNLFENNIRKIKANQSIQNHSSLILMSGIVRYGKIFDIFGNIIEGEICLTPNFMSTIDSFSSVTNELVIKWYDSIFDYKGSAVIGNEIIYIDTTAKTGTPCELVGENLIKIKNIKRGVYGTLKQEHYQGEIIRSAVNISDGAVSYTFDNKTTNIINSLFDVVTSTGNLEIFDNVRRWAYFNDNGTYDVTVKTPIYIFSGLDGALTCSYVGFVTNSDMSFSESSILIDFSNKFSLYWEEEMHINRVFVKENIKYVLSQILNIPESNIKYPTYYDEEGNEIEEYTINDFLTCDIVSTKEYNSYQEFLSAISKEMMIRLSFSGDTLIIQSELLKTYKTLDIKNAIPVTEYENIITMSDKTSSDAIFNKIDSEFLVRLPFYNETFKWKTKEFQNMSQFESDTANYDSYDIAIILDIKEYSRKEVVNHGLTCSLEFVNKGSISEYNLKNGFIKPIIYNFMKQNVKCDNNKGLIYEKIAGSNSWYFNKVTIVVGENAQYLNIGEPYQYVMLTDGKRDFTGTPIDININKTDVSLSTATFIFGFDRDSDNYERGFVEYNLLSEGYDNPNKEYVLYYGRL